MTEIKKRAAVEEKSAPSVEVREAMVVGRGSSQAERLSVEGLLALAVKGGATAESLERLISLQERASVALARSAFVRAMAELQSELPIIKKLKEGVVAKFAPLEDVVEMTRSIIKKHGFSYRWNTSQTDKNIRVVCIATHVNGHSEETEMTSEIEEVVTGRESGRATKSAPQRVASTITFLKRYTFINMFGVVVAGEDFDGRMGRLTGPVAGAVKSSSMTSKAKIVHLLKLLGEEVGSKEEIVDAVERLAHLDVLDAKNHGEIVNRLEILVGEKEENDENTTI